MRGPLRSRYALWATAYASLHKAVDQSKDVLVHNVRCQCLAQHSPIERIEKILEIGFHNPPTPRLEALHNGAHGLMGGASRSIAIATIAEGGFEARFKHIEDGMLHHAVCHCRDTNMALSPVTFAEHHVAQRLWPVGMYLQRLLYAL